MSALHTPGPLTVFTRYSQPELRDSAGELVAVTPDYAVCNARRLAACWNACDGISTKNLEDNLPVQELATRYNTVLAQRDALLAALDWCVAEINRSSPASDNGRAVITKIRGAA